jgi:hypothetical protein
VRGNGALHLTRPSLICVDTIQAVTPAENRIAAGDEADERGRF